MNESDADSTLEKCEVPLPNEQRRAQLYTMLSVLWIFPSFGALWIIGLGFDQTADSFSLSAIKFEQWLGVVLLLLHFYFLFQARHYRKLAAGLTGEAGTQ